MNEKTIMEKYRENCTKIGDLVYKNSVHDSLIRKLIHENSELDKTMALLKSNQDKNEQDTTSPVSQN
jgi:hypothetical protein